MLPSIFTEIINRNIPAKIIYEDEKVIAFNDIQNLAPVHFLVVPKVQLESLNSATYEDCQLLGHCLIIAKQIAKQMGIDQDGYRIVMNCNQNAGQTVFHLHFHVLGGKKLNNIFA